jgi:hypothetical protein
MPRFTGSAKRRAASAGLFCEFVVLVVHRDPGAETPARNTRFRAAAVGIREPWRCLPRGRFLFCICRLRPSLSIRQQETYRRPIRNQGFFYRDPCIERGFQEPGTMNGSLSLAGTFHFGKGGLQAIGQAPPGFATAPCGITRCPRITRRGARPRAYSSRNARFK